MRAFLRRFLGERQTPRRRPFRPDLEALEARAVPALFAGAERVNTTALVAAEQSTATTANASARNGMSVVVWTRRVGAHVDVAAQLYRADAARVGGEIKVAATSLIEGDPAVAMDDRGNFVVTWTRFLPGGDTNVHAARFSNTGRLLGSIFVAASSVREHSASVAVAGNGGFVVAYVRQPSSASSDVLARRFDAAGRAAGATFAVAATAARELNPAVAVATGADPRFSITYQVGSDVHLRRYARTGGLLGHHVVAGTRLTEALPAVAMNDAGAAVVAWQEFSNGAWSVRARTVSPAGRLGGVVHVANGQSTSGENLSSSRDNLTNVAVAMDRSDGDFVVTWLANHFASNMVTGNHASLHAFAAEVSAAGAVRRRVEVAEQAHGGDPSLQPPPFVYSIGPGVSIGGNDVYTVSYVVFAQEQFQGPTLPPFVQRRRGRL